MSTNIAAPPFQRTSLTWLCYAVLGWYAYLQGAMNPIMPLLRRDLDLNYTLGSLHPSAFALGMIVAGVFGDRLALRYGIRRVFWAGSAGMVVGASLLMVGAIAPLTIFGTFLMGVLGTMALVMIQTALVRLHSAFGSVALTESNVSASLTASVVPILVGIFEGIGWGWRWAIVVGIAVWVLIFVSQRSQQFPSSTPTAESKHEGSLPLLYWLYVLALFLGVCVEWSTWIWAADYFIVQAKVDAALAAGLVTFFTIGAVSGRITMSRLLRYRRPHQLMPVLMVIVLVGFPIFWLGTSAPMNVFGLFLLGIGSGAFFPLALSASVSAAGAAVNKGSARVTMAAGAAILVIPFILGLLADNVGIQRAYLMLPMLAVMALGVTLVANRINGKQRL